MVGYLKAVLKKLSSIWSWLGLALSFVVIFWVRWRIVVHEPLWLDEVFTFKFAQLSWRDIVMQTGYYVDYAHPPGFYLLAKVWLSGGSSELWLRLPALVMALASAWLLYRIMELLKAETGKWLVLLYFAGHWLMVQIGSELRMYQTVLFVMLLFVFQLFSLWQKKLQPRFSQQLVLMGLLTGAVYLDYAALWLLLVVCCVWLVAWWQRKQSAAWLGNILSGVLVLVLPQLLILVTHFEALQQLNLHLAFSGWHEVAVALHSLTGLPFGLGFGVGVVGLVAVFLHGQYHAMKTHKSDASFVSVFLAVSLALPTVVVLMANLFGVALLQQRNLLLVTLGFLVSLCWALDVLLQKLQLPLNQAVILFTAIVVLGWSLVTPKIPLSNNWFWIRSTVAQGYMPVFVGEHEYLMEPFLIYYSQYPSPIAFEYAAFSSVDVFNLRPLTAEKILVVYEESRERGAHVVTKSDFSVCSTAQCEVMGVR